MGKSEDKDLRQDDVSVFTKVLIHKAHGQRKMDSKFWRDDIYLDKNKEADPVNIKIQKKTIKVLENQQLTYIQSVLLYASWLR